MGDRTLVTNLDYPDGLREDHAAPRTGLRAHASLVSLIVLAALMIAALTGLLAGDRNPVQTAALAGATLSLDAPTRLRNGEFLEMRVRIAAQSDLTDATLAVSSDLWRDMTINTMIPAADTEEHKDGAFRFRYGALKAGEVLLIKIDGQINPPLTVGTRGEIALYDGDRRLGAMPVAITVLP